LHKVKLHQFEKRQELVFNYQNGCY
jgi:hypothetical protein